VELTVGGVIPGGVVRLPAAGGVVSVTASVRSITPLERVEIIYNGAVVGDVALSADRRRADYTASFRVAQSGWFHLLAEGAPSERFPLDVSYAQAFTNPVWVRVGDQPVRSRAAAEYGIRWVDKLRGLAEAWPGWRSQQEIDHVLSQFAEARDAYRQLAAEDTAGRGPVPVRMVPSSRGRAAAAATCWESAPEP
jgi:hypothetical protein